MRGVGNKALQCNVHVAQGVLTHSNHADGSCGLAPCSAHTGMLCYSPSQAEREHMYATSGLKGTSDMLQQQSYSHI